MKSTKLTRRAFVASTSTAAAGTILSEWLGRLSAHATTVPGPFQAIGTHAGEVTGTTVIVWTRRTAAPKRNDGGVIISRSSKGKTKQDKNESKINVPVDQLDDADNFL